MRARLRILTQVLQAGRQLEMRIGMPRIKGECLLPKVLCFPPAIIACLQLGSLTQCYQLCLIAVRQVITSDRQEGGRLSKVDRYGGHYNMHAFGLQGIDNMAQIALEVLIDG